MNHSQIHRISPLYDLQPKVSHQIHRISPLYDLQPKVSHQIHRISPQYDLQPKVSHRIHHILYKPMVSMFEFHRSDRGSNPGRGGKIS